MEYSSVVVTLFKADRTTLASHNYPVGSDNWGGLAGDFNGDGKLDLAIAGGADGGVYILLGNGDGTFQAAKKYSAPGSSLQSLALADFNGDGKLDVAAPDSNSSVVWVFLGNGDGTLRTPTSVPSGQPGDFSSILAADFNNDGKPDVAVNTSQGIALLLGKGDGTFQPAKTSPYGACPAAYLAYADLNNDGKLDIAAAGDQACLSLMLGNGDGTFQSGRSYMVANNDPPTLAIVPFSDGYFGLITADDLASGNGILALSPGDGTLLAPPYYNLGVTVSGITTADLNGDQIPDFVVSTYDATHNTNAVDVLLMGSDGNLHAPVSYALPATGGPSVSQRSVATGDLNHDGKADVVTAWPGSSQPGNVYVQLGNGDGTLATAKIYPAGNFPTSVVLADFNGDGKLDAAVANTGDLSVSSDPGSVSILLGNGDGTFRTPANYSSGLHPYLLVAGDFNGDGKPDLAVIPAVTGSDTSSASVMILINNGDGTFKTGTSIAVGSPGQNPLAIAAGDLNGDGKLDLAVALPSSGSSGDSVAILLGKGDGTFQAASSAALTNVPRDLAIADLNGDGKADLVVVHGMGAAYMLGNGDATFQAEQYVISGNPYMVAVTDFDNNGRPGLALANGQGALSALFNGFPAVTVSPSAPALGPLQAQQFTAQVFFSTSQAVAWSISPQVGTISASGVYTAPASIASQQTVTVTAASTANPANSGSATITLNAGTANQPPAAGAPTPGWGSGTSQSFVFTFSDPAGAQALGVVDVLINKVLDGRQACYIAYSVPTGTLYLVDDAGDAGRPYAGSMQLNGSGSVSNKQCTISGAGSSAVAGGTTLTLTLNISFQGGFAGNQVVYTAARDTGTGNSGWQPLGTWGVPGAAVSGPSVTGMSPAHTTSLGPTTYTFTFSDGGPSGPGWQDIGVADILINSAIDGRHACYIAFVPGTASVLLVDDAGDAGGPFQGMVLPGSGTVSNSQCAISGAGSSVSGSGNTLSLTLAITFTSSFAGNQLFFLAARNNTLNSNWQAVGTVAVP